MVRLFPAPDAELNSDAFWTYLPNARKLLESPWTFLTTDATSYHVAPLGYVWAALWGADPARIQLANCVLFLICILLMWRAATLLGGWLAGVISTALFVFHPDLMSYIPQVLTESIYLFGLMLLTASVVEYAVSKTRQRLWLSLAATGLAITLLARPVLQIFTLAALLAGLGLWTLAAWKRPPPGSLRAMGTGILNRPVCIALMAALVLPVAVVVKNGLSFDLWGMGTGAGSGLYYGVSPFKMGLEPVYSGFKYDAGITPLTVSPETQGHPLTLESDRINRLVAVDIVKNTTLEDNAEFFWQKLKAWLFYSTPELHMSSKLRTLRIFEWLAVAGGALALLIRARPRAARPPLRLPGAAGAEPQRVIIMGLLLLGILAMAMQLVPVLYNTRYSTYFIEPWLMLLAGVGVAILWMPPSGFSLRSGLRYAPWLISRLLIVILLAWVPIAWTKHSLRHETWQMDPYRPGPVAVLLDREAMGQLQSAPELAQSLEGHRWQLIGSPVTLRLPVKVESPESMSPEQVKDALWRLRLTVTPPEGRAPRSCRKLLLAYSNAYPVQDWYEPEPAVNLQLDGKPHTYALHGNDDLRPAGDGELSMTLHCPPGTILTWHGAELLRSTLPEAARALIHDNRPIDPYLRRDPR